MTERKEDIEGIKEHKEIKGNGKDRCPSLIIFTPSFQSGIMREGILIHQNW